MVRVGLGNPQVLKMYPDSHHPEHGVRCEAKEWLYITLEEWREIYEFQAFPHPTKEEALDIRSQVVENPSLDHILNKAMFGSYGDRMKQVLSGGHSFVLKNGNSQDLKGYVRYCVFFMSETRGEESIRPWTWSECYIKTPINRVIARFVHIFPLFGKYVK